MSKHEFIRKYRKLSTANRAAVKAYYDDMYRNATSVNRFTLAETALLWIRDAENDA